MKLLAFALAVSIAGPEAWAQGKDDDDAAEDEDDERDAKPARKKKVERSDEDDERDAKPARKKKVERADEDDEDAKPARKKKVERADEDDEDAKPQRKASRSEGEDDDRDFKKQDLTGHDLGTTKKENLFERDRFFVDKTDTDKTAGGTLIQGSITSTTFGYLERGGTLTQPEPGSTVVPSASQYSRLFTDLRLQTDFRHIAASRWEARVDVRGRAVNDPPPQPTVTGFVPVTNSTVQSGFLGKNELEVKELWLVRNGVRSDLFFGRQFVPDLGGVKFDGLRVDYASSSKFTLLGFGGLYPIRGSRSITTDYTELQSNPANDGTRTSAGKYTGTGGFGAAYRTLDAYGAFGGVAIVPLSSESPRVFATSTGYWRYGTRLDFYHLAVVDLVGANAVNAGLTNLSLGLNYKPDQRLRANLGFHRVDTETLNVQAQAFLSNPDPNLNVIQNEAYLTRIATNDARASLSAGLGPLQRFEITAAITYRRRGELELSAPPQLGGAAPLTATLPAAQSAEVYGAITDRRSVGGLRLGVDGSRVLGIGSATYRRTKFTAARVFAAHELGNGHGEWEAEAAYSTSEDDSAGMTCGDLVTCYGSSSSTILSAGANLYYRFNRDWFMLGSLFVNRTSITHVVDTMSTADPTVTGVSGYFRIAYRF